MRVNFVVCVCVCVVVCVCVYVCQEKIRLAKNKGKVSMFIPVGAAAEVGVGRMLAVPALTVLALMSIFREGCSEIFPGFTVDSTYACNITTLCLCVSLSHSLS
jgi:hypothetical protein